MSEPGTHGPGGGPAPAPSPPARWPGRGGRASTRRGASRRRRPTWPPPPSSAAANALFTYGATNMPLSEAVPGQPLVTYIDRRGRCRTIWTRPRSGGCSS